MEKPLKPSEHAETQLIAAILEKKYNPGDHLPGERLLAEQLGVTRPTLRETLKHLSAQGWVTIRQGKPTRVNNYIEEGGLGLLSAMVRHGKNLSKEMILHLMEVRVALFPGIAELAVAKYPDDLILKLQQAKQLENKAKAFAAFDWELQLLMVKLTDNPVFRMIINDFPPLFETLGQYYFQNEEARSNSAQYYAQLLASIENGGRQSRDVVRETMAHAVAFWKRNH